MSAFVVSDKHIDQLANLIVYGPAGASRNWTAPRFNGSTACGMDIDAIALALLRENIISVNARYGEGAELPTQYTAKIIPITGRMQLAQAFKALDCYEYQSCEHEGWDTSPLRQLCNQVRRQMIALLPGYSEAQWELR